MSMIQFDFFNLDERTTIDIIFKVRGLLNASTFPGVGQLIYSDGQQDCLVLDSFASTTNLLESTVQPMGAETPIFEQLPYLRMTDIDGKYLSNSIVLPHRLASGYLLKNKSAMLGNVRFSELFLTEVAEHGLHKTVLKYCPMSLLHGVWFSQVPGHYKITKSISGSLIAVGVVEAIYGGLAKDRVWANSSTLDLGSFDEGAARASELGIGMIPHNTKRYFCQQVNGFFQIINPRIEEYPIPTLGKELITGLAVFEILKFIESVPSHRVDCNLKVSSVELNRPFKIGNTELNRSAEAKEIVEGLLKKCSEAGIIGSVETVTVELNHKTPKSKEKPNISTKRKLVNDHNNSN